MLKIQKRLLIHIENISILFITLFLMSDPEDEGPSISVGEKGFSR